MCELLKQMRVAVVGTPDAGKSTFIKYLVKAVTGRELSTDTLMREVHWSDGKDPMGNPDTRTIKCAKIMFEYRDREWCFYDCPGHLEYNDQIRQGINGADAVILIQNMLESKEYRESYYNQLVSLGLEDKTVFKVKSHAKGFESLLGLASYNTNDEHKTLWTLNNLMFNLHFSLNQLEGHDIEKEAIELIKENVKSDKKNIMFFSGGKDSAVGLKLFEMAGLIDSVDVYFPRSGFDFPVVERWMMLWETYFNKLITPFSNNIGLDYDHQSEYDLLHAKAISNEELIKKIKPNLVSIQYRASDEGVRSKDYHISQRENYVRFSPVFYFSETNIWRFIEKYNIPVNPLYFKGYRSLGDKNVTEPCMPEFNTVSEIINYIRDNPSTTERDGRKKQDQSVPFAMEKLRNVGFF